LESIMKIHKFYLNAGARNIIENRANLKRRDWVKEKPSRIAVIVEWTLMIAVVLSVIVFSLSLDEMVM